MAEPSEPTVTASRTESAGVGTAPARLPEAGKRWRCGSCGNLTRFDVVRTATVREFWHLDLSGEAQVEESDTLDETIGSVVCRWCGRADAIEVVDRPGGGPP
jgi:hypothetical protein